MVNIKSMPSCNLNNNANMNLQCIDRILAVHEDITIINVNIIYQLNND